MEAKKDIGKAIREKMDSLDRQPGDALWDAISRDLDKKKKKRFPFFWFYIVSTSIISIGLAAYVLSNLQGASVPVVTTQDSIQNNTSVTGNPAIQDSNSRDDSSSSANSKTFEEKTADAQAISASEKKRLESNTERSVSNTHKESKTSSKTVIQKQYAAGTNHSSNRSKYAQSSNDVKGSKAVSASKNNPTQTYTQTERNSSVTPAKRNKSAEPDNKVITQNSESAQLTNSKTAVSLPISADSNNSSSDKENTSSTNTKNIETINTEGISDTTKVVADSLKTTVTEQEKPEDKTESKKDSIPPSKIKKLSAFAYAGPSFFNFPDNRIQTDSTTASVSTKTVMRYGALFGYRINDKLSIRAGLSIYKLKQSANSIKLNYVMGGSAIDPQMIPPSDFEWVNYNNAISNAEIVNTLGDGDEAIININRELSYVEIPLEVSYNFYERRFGLNAFAGGSMLLLNKNEVFANNGNGEMLLGEWNAAEKTSFAANLGLGLYYKLTPSLQLNAEPVFNYYFNSYKDSKPYSFTFRVGLQYNFDF